MAKKPYTTSIDTDISGDFKKLEEEREAYITQRRDLLTKFYNSSTVTNSYPASNKSGIKRFTAS